MSTGFLLTSRALRLRCAALCVLALAAGCRKQDMDEQPKFKPLQPTDFFTDGKSSRPLILGTFARSNYSADDPLFIYSRGADAQGFDQPVVTFPFPITKADLDRGQQRYEIYCSACHGYAGYGNGMIVQRGFSTPPSFHQDKFRTDPATGQFPVGHIVDVIANGKGAMYSYGQRVAAEDRWRIAAYIRALQVSQDPALVGASASAATQPSGGAQ